MRGLCEEGLDLVAVLAAGIVDSLVWPVHCTIVLIALLPEEGGDVVPIALLHMLRA